MWVAKVLSKTGIADPASLLTSEWIPVTKYRTGTVYRYGTKYRTGNGTYRTCPEALFLNLLNEVTLGTGTGIARQTIILWDFAGLCSTVFLKANGRYLYLLNDKTSLLYQS